MSAEGAWCPRLMGAFDPQGLEDMFSPGPLFLSVLQYAVLRRIPKPENSGKISADSAILPL